MYAVRAVTNAVLVPHWPQLVQLVRVGPRGPRLLPAVALLSTTMMVFRRAAWPVIILALHAIMGSHARPATVSNSECTVLPQGCAHAKMGTMTRVYRLSCVGPAMLPARHARAP